MESHKLQQILEAAIFAAVEPLLLTRMMDLFEPSARVDKNAILKALENLVAEYQNQGIELKNLASGYQFQVKSDFAPWIKKLFAERPPRYSRALMETLALIAYRQPITRSEIEAVRGVVVSTQIVRTLMEHGWVRIVGHKDVPGRPGLYATTKQFLDHFGLKSLTDLPPLSEVKDLEAVGKELEEKLECEQAMPTAPIPEDLPFEEGELSFNNEDQEEEKSQQAHSLEDNEFAQDEADENR